MINRMLLATAAIGLAFGAAAASAPEAQAGERFTIFLGELYEPFYPVRRLMPPPRAYRHFILREDLEDDEFDQAYDGEFYEPEYQQPLRKTAPAAKRRISSTGSSGEAGLAVAAPAEAKTAAKTPTGLISCAKAGSIVSGYGFSSVKPADCKGQVYAFNAARDGKSFAIKMNAVSGELTEVKKIQ